MTALQSLLPAPTNAWQDELLDDLDENDGESSIIAGDEHPEPAIASSTSTAVVAVGKGMRRAPPYLKRQNWVPRTEEDFDDGGAYPEVHVPQYPLKMGQKSRKGEASGQIVALEVDETGKVQYDAILKQRMRKNTWVHSSFKDLVEKNPDDKELMMPDEDAVQESTDKTREALEKLVNTRIQASKPTSDLHASGDNKKGPTYLRYTPGQGGGSYNSGAKQRIVSLVDAQRDPLDPPKHRHKKVPGGIPSPPPPVQHSPTKKLTSQDQQDWKIPACISNWKNPKGYTIPLDKRMAADGSGVQEAPMNNDFGQFVEALYIAERNACEEVKRRNELQRRKAAKQIEGQEEELKLLASQVRKDRAGLQKQMSAHDEVAQRDEIRSQRKREREDDRRDLMKKSKSMRDRDRDVSERIALGQAGKMTTSGEGLYDSRLFNQEQGVGGNHGADDAYNVYDKPLVSGSSANQLYRPNKERIAEYQQDGDAGNDGLVDGLLQRDASSFKPDKGFKGATSSRGGRDRPVEFEREDEVKNDSDDDDGEDDPFGLEEFMSEAKSGKSKGSSRPQAGSMAAAAGGSSARSETSRSRVNFQRERN